MKAKITTDLVIDVIVPDWYKDFHCIGKECKHSCCNDGWGIFIDKKTYLKYRNTDNTEFQDMLKDKAEILPENIRDDNDYAQFKHVTTPEEKITCAFITDGGLCYIQKNFGEEYLCRTCSLYPRDGIIAIGKNHNEMHISPSCPVVVQNAILPNQHIKFAAMPMSRDKNKNSLFRHKMYRPLELGVHSPKEILLIRQFCIDIIYDRSAAIADRILVIATAVKKLRDNAGHAGGGVAPEAEFAKYARNIAQFNGIVAGVKDNPQIQRVLKMASVDCSVQVGFKIRNDFIANIFKDKTERSLDSAMDYILDVSDKFIERNWDNFLETHSHIVENYLAYYIYHRVFPFVKTDKDFDFDKVAILLAVQYCTLRFLLSYKADIDEIDDDTITAIVVNVSRTFIHNTKISDELLDKYKKLNAYNAAYISFMLK